MTSFLADFECFESVLNSQINNRIDKCVLEFDYLNVYYTKFPQNKITPIASYTNESAAPVVEVDLISKTEFLSTPLNSSTYKKFKLLELGEKLNASNKENSEVASDRNFVKLKKLKKKKCSNLYDENFVNEVNTTQVVGPFKDLIASPAWNWPFELDNFQKQAILGLEKGKTVFVSAHTSAGKTVVAEYAIAMCYNRGGRVIYTSPIKALSNQKYRDFKLTFGSDKVGLLTGDIKTGTNNYILVMTTEILHNMLKNSCSTLKDLEVVIMDEVHYLNDDYRGHIWEQLMILLPKQVQLVMLSATVPNTLQFGEWLGRIRNTQIQVISTLKRPVPLEIFLFLGNGLHQKNEFYRIMDRDKNFQINEYNAAVDFKNNMFDKAKKKQQIQYNQQLQQQQQQQQQQKQQEQKKYKKPATGSSSVMKHLNQGNCGSGVNSNVKDRDQWLGLFETLKKHDSLPVICFMFSRKKIQNIVMSLTSMDFLDKRDKYKVNRYIKDVISRKLTNKADQDLKQIKELHSILIRGIAMHHAGLLPILKEVVEILFSQGYVKVLYATETFAVGVNMPARTVVFDSIEKHDGHTKRMLLSGEFTQMAGRAGRRGLDSIGQVIIIVKPQADIFKSEQLKRVLIGSASQLESKFKISYNMILSLYRSRQFSVQYMIRHSFIEAPRLKNYENDCSVEASITERLEKMNISGLRCIDQGCDADQVNRYYQFCKYYTEARNKFVQILEKNGRLRNHVLTSGRLVLLDKSSLINIQNNGSSEQMIYLRQLVPGIVVSVEDRSGQLVSDKITVLTMNLREGAGKQDTGDLRNIGNNNRNKKMTQSEEEEDLKFKNNVEKVVIIRPGCDEIISQPMKDVVPLLISVPIHIIHRICQGKSIIDPQKINRYWKTGFFRKESIYEWTIKNSEFSEGVKIISGEISANNLKAINYEKELGLKDEERRETVANVLRLEEEITLMEMGNEALFNVRNCTLLLEHMEYMYEIENLLMNKDIIQQKLSDDNLQFLPEYRSKVQLLKSFGFINQRNDTIELKGRIACEIESYELVVTEMLLSGLFMDASPSEVAATLSCIVYENRNAMDSAFKLKEASSTLKIMLEYLSSTVEKINVKQNELQIAGCEIEQNCAILEPVRMWTLGAPFGEIVKLTEVQAGDIVRCIQRLCELMRHCESAAKVMSNFQLAASFKHIEDLLYRGVVASSSLYVDEGFYKKNDDDDDDDDEEDDNDDDDDGGNFEDEEEENTSVL